MGSESTLDRQTSEVLKTSEVFTLLHRPHPARPDGLQV